MSCFVALTGFELVTFLASLPKLKFSCKGSFIHTLRHARGCYFFFHCFSLQFMVLLSSRRKKIVYVLVNICRTTINAAFQVFRIVRSQEKEDMMFLINLEKPTLFLGKEHP